MLNVPVPPIYLAEQDDGTYTAIDGKQRLKAVNDFVENRFALRELSRMEFANGLRFRDLPTEIANPFRLRPYLRVVTLLRQTNPELKYEVFLRLNQGGEPLNNQEIRNVAFRGPLNDAIFEGAKNEYLRKKLKITSETSAAYREMSDVEYVLRFLTLDEQAGNYRGDLSRAMDDFMRKYQNTPDSAGAQQYFESTIQRVENIWGTRAFQRPEGTTWRDQLLAGMFDAQMLAVSRMTDAELAPAIAKSADVIKKTIQLFSDPEFDKSVRTGTNTPARISYRVNQVRNLLASI